MSFQKIITLPNGDKMPQIGFGTWQSFDGVAANNVEVAVRNGYRHLDLAHVYENQVEIGETLKKVIPSVVKREELFITGKLWNSSHKAADVEKELDLTLQELGLDYLDLYLIHWPVAFASGRGLYPDDPHVEGTLEIDTETTLVETWKAMIALPKTKVRAIGVSNFKIKYIEGIIAGTGVVPTVHQLEMHPYLPQHEILAYCKEKNIHVTAYSPLGGNTWGAAKVTDDPAIIALSEKLGVPSPHILLAWAVQRGVSTIPKSNHAHRIIENFRQIELSKEDFDAVTAVGANKEVRYNIPFRYVPKWDISIFEEGLDKDAKYKVKIA